MNIARLRGCLAAALVSGLVGVSPGSAQPAPAGPAAAPPASLAWTPKPSRLAPYVGPHKPLTKLSDVRASHGSRGSWRQVIVDDKHMVATWVQAAPGAPTRTQILADHRFSMIVWDGQIRVSIQGQEPFIATKGFIVQVPFRVPYTLETIGDAPSLRLELVPQDTAVLFDASEPPPPPPAGTTWYKARLQGQDRYEREQSATAPWQGRPYFDFFRQAEAVTGGSRSIVRDDRVVVNVIRGRGVARQPDAVKGHFHLEYAEFWLIAEGQISYLIEGVPYFVAEAGDIVYVPPGRFHRAQFAGSGMSTRIPVNGYPNGSHHYDPDE